MFLTEGFNEFGGVGPLDKQVYQEIMFYKFFRHRDVTY